jgi:hypothetical protein
LTARHPSAAPPCRGHIAAARADGDISAPYLVISVPFKTTSLARSPLWFDDRDDAGGRDQGEAEGAPGHAEEPAWHEPTHQRALQGLGEVRCLAPVERARMDSMPTAVYAQESLGCSYYSLRGAKQLPWRAHSRARGARTAARCRVCARSSECSAPRRIPGHSPFEAHTVHLLAQLVLAQTCRRVRALTSDCAAAAPPITRCSPPGVKRSRLHVQHPCGGDLRRPPSRPVRDLYPPRCASMQGPSMAPRPRSVCGGCAARPPAGAMLARHAGGARMHAAPGFHQSLPAWNPPFYFRQLGSIPRHQAGGVPQSAAGEILG